MLASHQRESLDHILHPITPPPALAVSSHSNGHSGPPPAAAVCCWMCTFVIEAIDEWESWKKPMLIAIGQSLSVFCGLVLPLISSSKTAWTMTLSLSCALHLIMFVRIWQKTTKLEVMEVSEGPASFTARRTGLSLSLHRLAAVVWTLFAVVYFVDYGVRAYLLSNPMLATRGIIEKFSGTDWAMVFDCIIDVFAKMMLSSSIGEGMPLSMAASVPMPWLT